MLTNLLPCGAIAILGSFSGANFDGTGLIKNIFFGVVFKFGLEWEEPNDADALSQTPIAVVYCVEFFLSPWEIFPGLHREGGKEFPLVFGMALSPGDNFIF